MRVGRGAPGVQHRVRDLGRALASARQRGAAAYGALGLLPRAQPPNNPNPGWWEDFIGPGAAIDTEPLPRDLHEPAGRLLWEHGTFVDEPCDRRAVGDRLPDRHGRGHGARPAPDARPPGNRHTPRVDRRLARRHAVADAGSARARSACAASSASRRRCARTRSRSRCASCSGRPS